ncbi:MAG: hypothetical protein ACTSX1_15150 [Candidatus Heimdallarchaeaceae archaeon]
MSRVIFVPQYPTPMRYQEWWFHKFPQEFREAGFHVHTLGEKYAEMLGGETGDLEMFSPINKAIDFETAQINEYMELNLKEDDILFLADLSFPGIFSNVFVHKHPKRMFAFCHATSLNYKDYFAPVQKYKYPIEKAHASMFDAVFVGSDYHQDKLNWNNTLVTPLPYPPIEPITINKKNIDIISASRPNPQKVDSELEAKVEEKFGKIERPQSATWFNYFWNIAASKILLITSFEDTFGYQIVDAVINGCIPLAPNRCAYPELLPREYLYDDEDELIRRIDFILNGDPEFGTVDVPQLLCHKEMTNFYKHVIEVMKGE